MKSKLDPRLVLALLDDQPDLRMGALDWSPRLSITPALKPGSAVSKAAAKAAQAHHTAAASPAPKHSAPQVSAASKNAGPLMTPSHKIIRARRTLKELMHEYNGPSAGPLQRSGASPGYALGNRHFNSDQVELIRLPEIPGKILRPT